MRWWRSPVTRGVRIQVPAVAAIGVNQRCYLVFKRERQHQHLLVGGSAELLYEGPAHLGDVAWGCNSILVGVGHGTGSQVESKILDDFVIAETAGLPS